jgi:urease gamma subunit
VCAGLKSFGYVTGLKNNYFNAIKVFKTKVMRSQRNGKDNVKMKYCRLVAGRRLTTGSILNNLN